MTALDAATIARALASRIDALARDLLPGGKRIGKEWRCGSIAGEPGHSLGLQLTGAKAGRWADFAGDQHGDALDLVRAVQRLDTPGTLAWSRNWLALAAADHGRGDDHRYGRGTRRAAPVADQSGGDDRIARALRVWNAAMPIAGTAAERYLIARRLAYRDPRSDVLRYAPRHARRNPDSGETEHHPALLALLRNMRTEAACGIINVYLRPDGSDRLRDARGKTTWGRAAGAAVMLSPYDDVTMGLTVCEGAETGMALLMAGLAPAWALGGAGNLAALPVLGDIESLTIGADADTAGQRAAANATERWHAACREAVIVAPPAGDWADSGRAA